MLQLVPQRGHGLTYNDSCLQTSGFCVKCVVFTVIKKIGVGQQFLAHVSNIKFNGYVFDVNRVAPFEYTDTGRTDLASLTVAIGFACRPCKLQWENIKFLSFGF